MIIVGLTGSIGMGKSTTAGFFAEEGFPVNDADSVVHDLYLTDAVEPVGEAFPGTIQNGVVDRRELSRQLSADPQGFSRLEKIVHPLVREREKEFLRRQEAIGADFVVLDIPLLFETQRETAVDVVIVVTCDAETQRKRVLARPNMTEEKLSLILARQMSDEDKRKKADFIVDTSNGLEEAQDRVKEIIASLKTGRMTEKTGA